jgi:hypothetical protein
MSTLARHPWRLAASVVAVGLAAAAVDAGGLDTLEALGSRLRSQPAWQADYTQEYVPAGMTIGDRESGRVWIAWPDLARFDAGDPVVRRMGLEGRRVRLVDLEASACDEHVLDDAEWARIPLAAVLEPRQAVDRFTVLDGDAGEVVLVPREPGGIDRVEVWIGEDGMPTVVRIVDPQGAVNRLEFMSWAPADRAPTGGWLPAVPAGFECAGDVE